MNELLKAFREEAARWCCEDDCGPLQTWGEFLVNVTSDYERFGALAYEAHKVLCDMVREAPVPA